MRRLILWIVVWGLTWMIGRAGYSPRHAADVAGLASGKVKPVDAHDAAPVVGDTWLVDLVDGTSAAERDAVAATVGVGLAWWHADTADEALAVITSGDGAAAADRLADDPRVEVVEPLFAVSAYDYPNDPLYPKQWNLRAVNAPHAWDTTPRGRGVVVAVLDTGIARVEDLGATVILDGRSFVGRDAAAWRDENGHGTHVAGTIAQSTHNGVGVAGVAPDAALLPVKVLDRFGAGSTASIAAGIDWAVDEGAHVLNLSLGSTAYSRVVHLAVRKAVERGVVVVAAAGNARSSQAGYPAYLPEVVGVSAHGPTGELAPYSNWGTGVDLIAPGGDTSMDDGGILQDTIAAGGGHAYRALQGTSMASPHVAGAAAVLLSVGVAADEVRWVLAAGAEGEGWTPERGFGALDLKGALDVARGEASVWVFLVGALWAGVVGWAFRQHLWWMTLLGGLVAGGLPWFGHEAGAWWSSGLLDAPAWFGWPTWVHFPLWSSSLVPLVVAFVGGATPRTRVVAMALCAGWGAHLFWGAASGAVHPWWMSPWVARCWLVLHGVISVGAAVVLGGVSRLVDAKGE